MPSFVSISGNVKGSLLYFSYCFLHNDTQERRNAYEHRRSDHICPPRTAINARAVRRNVPCNAADSLKLGKWQKLPRLADSYSDKRSIWGIPRYSAERRYGNGKGDRQGEGPRKSQAGTICYQLLHWRRNRFGGFLRSCSGVISPDGGFHRRLFDDLYWLVEAGAVR